MRESLDDILGQAGDVLRDSPELDESLARLASVRAEEARPASKRRAKLIPVLAIGTALAVAGGGAVAASQWGPWTYVADEDTDLVVTREWSDVNGAYLGTCETRMSTDVMPEDVRDLALDYLQTVDVDSIEPDPEWVAGLLHAVGRLDDVGRLIPGAVPGDFSAGGEGWRGPALDYFTDARILQDSMVQKVFNGMSDHLVAQMSAHSYGWDDLTTRLETKCTTDPDYTGAL